MSIFDLIILIWLIILTFLVILSYRIKIVYIKKVKNKRDIRAKRYIIFDIIGEGEFDVKDIEEEIKKSVKELGGKIWLEISDPKVILIYQNQGIISTNRSGYKIVLASLPLVKSVKDKPILLVPRRTTGSLKRAKKLLGIK